MNLEYGKKEKEQRNRDDFYEKKMKKENEIGRKEIEAHKFVFNSIGSV